MTFTEDDLQALDALIRQACAAEALPRFGRLDTADISAKSTVDDLVTIADIETQRALTRALNARFPGAAVMGEETVTPGFDYAADALLFVIDPIDGTWNYAKGVPAFGCIVSVLSHGRTIAGVIHYPTLGDSLITREGAGLRLAGAQGSRSLPPLSADPEVHSAMMPLSQFSATHRAALVTVFGAVPRLVSMQCSAYEYRLLLTGETDVFLSTGLMPWDHAAGQLMVREIGGAHSATLRGGIWPDAAPGEVLLTARNRQIWNRFAAPLAEALA